MLWEEKITEFLDEFNVTDVNREIILEYLDAVQDIGKNPAENTIKNKTVMMLFIAQHVKTDIDKLTKHDIINFKKVVQTSIRKDGKPLKHSTKMNYLVGFKQFLKWFVEEHKRPDYNDLIKTIKITRKPSDKNPSDLLTEEEIFKMIEVADNDRDKAIIAVLHESGCREGELVSSQLKHIKFTNDCIFLTFPTGKTGTRTVPLIASITYLRKWCDLHPLKGDSGAPLWTTLRKKDSKYKAITEDSVLHIVHKLAERADIQKRCYPHLFRHTCATDLSQDLNESQMKEFLGWKQSSNMPSVYVHLSGQNIENAIRAKHGLVEQKKAEPKIQRCPRCHVVVSKNIESCDKCGTALGARVQQMDELVVEAMRKVILEENPEIFEKVAKVMLKKQTESINNSVKQSC